MVYFLVDEANIESHGNGSGTAKVHLINNKTSSVFTRMDSGSWIVFIA
jgi:hypothetical protein